MSTPQQPDGENLLREAVSTTPHCLTIEQLDAYLRAAAAQEQMRTCSTHLASCARCANELAMLREFLGAEVPQGQREDVRAVARALEGNRERLLSAAPGRVETRPSWWGSLAELFTMPRLSFAAAALVLAVSVGLYVRQGRVVETPGEFSGSGVYRSGKVTGITPSGDVAAVPSVVTWSAVPGAQRYQVRMLEVDGNELWKTVVAGSSAPLPAAARIHIAFTKTLLLEVTAIDEAGKQIAISEATRFRLMSRRR
ncbi:MAG: hypothetical protein J0L64_12630 [Acidobacteria bacterium]|nr:hypothetical protein [Acidobacteriota bacterium]